VTTLYDEDEDWRAQDDEAVVDDIATSKGDADDVDDVTDIEKDDDKEQ
jgi:hypothetical protein